MMKRCICALAIALVAWVAAGPARAAEPVRILLTYGGHGFEQDQFFGMFDAMDGIQYTKAELPKDAGLLKPGLEKKYDCIVMYDMVGAITPEQREAFVKLLKKGIGVVSLHHNLGAHRDWPEFTNIIGGRFLLNDTEIGGKKYPKSTWSHGESLKITVVDKDHPITKGIKDFEIHDETYGGYYTAPDVHLLLKTDHPKNDPEIAWTKQYGNSRVVYIMLGHDAEAWHNPNYPKLLSQAIRWAAGK